MKNLGFGFMRLPLLNSEDPTSFDYPLIRKMVDAFVENGFSYFDTAYVYHGFKAEEALRESLVKRYSRDQFQLATKMPMREIDVPGDMNRIFDEHLANLGVEFIDYYLLHNIGVNSYKKACEMDSFIFCLQKKAEGKIHHLGMSFHDSPELLEEILSHHPELDFIQLQINYIDWDDVGIQARKCHAVARKYHKPIIVMEPCKGGNLANVPENVESFLRGSNPVASPASWAIRFAASQEGVFMVLSGMNTMAQLWDNMSYMKEFHPLDQQEYVIIEKSIHLLHESKNIACTNCRYCMDGCPQNIAIPDYFALYNDQMRSTSANFSSQIVYYLNLTSTHGKAKECIECGQCEDACPQHLKIIELLKLVSEKFDNIPPFPRKNQK